MITITKKTNGVLINARAIPQVANPRLGISDAWEMFVPSNFPNIAKIELFDDRVVVTSLNNAQYNLNLTGANGSFPISQIGEEGLLQNCQSIQDIFDKLINIL